MFKRYFKLSQDVEGSTGWDLGNPTTAQGLEVENPWMFREGAPVPDIGDLKVPMGRPGLPLDFTLAGFSIPVVHSRIASLFLELAPRDVQLLPVSIQGHADAYQLLVATRLIRCIDDEASEEVELWAPEDGRPEKVGQYRDVSGMRIDPSKVGDAKVFRTWGWSVALIVSEELKAALERMGATGVKFQAV
ncbi:imm11 family protein [Melittangium boletus]|uniref:imm11 family protein n=1 Tax=Melittangium boletus TaxID=83453 RepID=UPI003DA683E3